MTLSLTVGKEGAPLEGTGYLKHSGELDITTVYIPINIQEIY